VSKERPPRLSSRARALAAAGLGTASKTARITPSELVPQEPTVLPDGHLKEVILDLPGKGDKPPKERKPSQRELAVLSEIEKKFDPNATQEDCRDDLRRIQAENPYAYINRNMYRHLGLYSDSTWGQYFGTFLQFRRGADLELSRGQHAHERELAKHQSLDVYRKYYAQGIAPITMLYPQAPKKRINTLMCISDNHDIMQDPFVWRVFLEVLKDFQPDVVGFNGDQADCYEFNRYGIDPRIANAVEALTFLRDKIFRAAREVAPDSEFLWILGNHEWRLQKHFADASPYMRSVLGDFHGWTWEDLFGIRDLQINVTCKWDLAAYSKTDVRKQVASNYKVLWESFVMMHIRNDGFNMPGTSGHIHKQKLYTGNTMVKGAPAPFSWTVTPSACRGDAEYTDGFDKSDRGFDIFHVMPDSGIVVPEPVLIQGDFAAVAGRYYYRRPDEVYIESQQRWDD
jgi:hypothetical protein